MATEPTVDFGYQSVPKSKKQQKVAAVFDSVATRYDRMNDVMSLGVHRLWKRYAIDASGVRCGDKILDLAGGTGDLTRVFSKQVGAKGQVVLADINANMLRCGRDRLIDQGLIQNIEYTQVNAENLAFASDYFQCVSIAFGLRNVTDKAKALAEMHRVLKPGGRLLVLEFSKPTNPLFSRLYDWYSFACLPAFGQWVAGDRESYQYLAESIRRHPDQETLKTMVLNAGFSDCRYENLTGGVVALHIASKAS